MRLHDDALALVAVIGLIIPTSTILVALRLYVRWRNRGFGLDDGLVLAGWVSVAPPPICALADAAQALFIPSIALLIPAAYNGLGMHDGEYTLEQMKRALKVGLDSTTDRPHEPALPRNPTNCQNCTLPRP